MNPPLLLWIENLSSSEHKLRHQGRPGAARLCGASSFATSITTKAHLGHSNDRNPGVLLSSFMAARQLRQLFSVPIGAIRT
jgi:hypothetical protein